MNKIDCKEWREYNLCGKDGLFECFGSKTTPKLQLEQNGYGEYPYITTQGTDNGVAGYYNFYTEFGNVLTIDSAVLGTCFFQSKNFSASDHIEILKPKFNMTKNIALYLCTIINRNGQVLGYAYNLKRSQTALKKEKIKLPSKINEKCEYEPDWQYMEQYIDSIKQVVEQKFSKIKQIKEDKNIINTQQWAYFHLYDIFDIDMGSKLDKIKMKMDNPQVDFVGRANKEQGVTAKVNIIENIPPYKAGNLTLALGGAYLGSCFIQRNDFYTSQNVIVLKPKTNMSFRVKQFLSTTIFVESQLHYKAFIDELNPHIKTDFEFKLPIDKDGNPDWQYMDDYILNIEDKVKNTIKNLS